MTRIKNQQGSPEGSITTFSAVVNTSNYRRTVDYLSAFKAVRSEASSVDEAHADAEAGRGTYYETTDAFIASLESRLDD